MSPNSERGYAVRMEPEMRGRYGYGTLVGAALIALALPGVGPPALAGEEAPAVEALLPELLRTDLGKPFPMAAIKFGPEFWQALEADAGGQAQDNLFRKLFSGGLLFGIGPLNSVLAQARGDEAAVRWTAPPTLKVSLILQIDQPNVQVSVEGQVVPLKAEAPGADPNSLLNQLQFVFFPLRMSGGQALLADMARSMTLVVSGLAPDAVQRFTWESATATPQTAPYQQNQGPIVVQQQAPSHRDQMRAQFDRAMGQRMGAAGPAAAPGLAGAGGGLGGGMGGGPGGAIVGEPAGPEPPAAPEEGVALPELIGPPDVGATPYPMARATSLVGAVSAETQRGVPAEQLSESFATIDHVARTDGSVTLDYYTNSIGLQEVEVTDSEGRTLQRITSGPAPLNGRALASWRPMAAKGDKGEGESAVTVRNWVQTALGAQVSESTAPIPPTAGVTEPPSAMAPGPQPVTDVSVEEISVAGDLLQVRAHVAPVRWQGGLVTPPVSITITNEAGEVVKQLEPTPPPAPGRSYVFAWDVTDEAGERVADGRYVLRIGASAGTAQGSARSELRYWVDVPVEKTQRRLAALGPTAVQTLQAELAEQRPGLVLLAYLAPEAGHLAAFVEDAAGRVVRHLVDDDIVQGAQKLIWDGTDDDGQPLADASYAVNFELDGGEAGVWWGVVALEGLEAAETAGDG